MLKTIMLGTLADGERVEAQRKLLVMLEKLIEFQQEHIRSGKSFDTRPRSPGIEDDGGLVAWKCAELRESGTSARPYLAIQSFPGGGTLYQWKILMPDGTVVGAEE